MLMQSPSHAALMSPARAVGLPADFTESRLPAQWKSHCSTMSVSRHIRLPRITSSIFRKPMLPPPPWAPSYPE